MSDVMNFFKALLIAQLFYAFAITLLAYAMPTDSLVYIDSVDDITNDINLETVGNDIEQGLQSQTNIPVIELGALVFYSGNLLIDLLINFIFALPQMLAILVNLLMMLFNIDSYLFAVVQLFASVVITTLYFIGLMQLITGIRSGRLV